MPQTNPQSTYPLVESALSTFADWFRRMSYAIKCRSGDCLNAEEFGLVARDIGVTPSELEDLVRLGPHAADELPQLMTALNIDIAKVTRLEPLVLRDLERVCSICKHKRECAHNLAAGTAAQSYRRYCGNASTLDSLEAPLDGKPRSPTTH